MPDHKLREATMPTPSRSNLAQILLDLRGVEGVGLCSLQQSDIQLCLESYRQENNLSIENDQSSQQDTCNCRKSKCLKLYCQCFAARATCSSSCRCVSCENRPDNATVRDAAVNMILERNPNAFDSKYRPTAPAAIGTTTTGMSSTFTAITSVAHKNGCRCRKSMCLKKYCECYQGGVPCSSICTCLSCQNTAPSTLLAAAAAAAASSSSTAAANAATVGAVAALQTANSDLLLLSNHSKLSDQSLFANPSRLNEANEYAGESTRSFVDKDFGRNDTGLGGVNRPPLAPSLKRKRESATGSAGNKEETEGRGGREAKSVKQQQQQQQQDQGQGQGLQHSEQEQEQDEQDEQTFLVPPPLTPAGVNMSMSMSMNLSREQQKQLLNELLFQELQSQGMLTSPLTSYLTNNCPGLMQQSEGTTLDDLMNIFRRGGNDSSISSSSAGGAGNGGGMVVGTPAAAHPAGGTLLSYTPAIAHEDLKDGRAGTATCKPDTNKSTGLTSASPNTFSIATALALLAASGHFQTFAAAQQQQQTDTELSAASGAGAAAGKAMGICEDASALQLQQTQTQTQTQGHNNNIRSRSSVPTSALALASARRQQQLQMYHDHDPFSSLTKPGIGGGGGPLDACTPVAAAADLQLGSRGDIMSSEVPSSSSFSGERASSSSSRNNFGHFSQSSSGGLTDGETTVGSKGSSSNSRESSFLSDESMCSISMSGGSESGSEGKETSMLLPHKYKHHFSNKLGGSQQQLQLQAFSPQEPSNELLLQLGLPAKALFTNDGPLSPDNLVASSIAILEHEDRRDCDDRLLRQMAKENASPNKAAALSATAEASMRTMIGMEKHNNGGSRHWR